MGNILYTREFAPSSESASSTACPAIIISIALLCAVYSASIVQARPPLAPYDTIPGRPTTVRQPQPAALSPSDQQNPGYQWAAHSQGNIQLTLNNHGEIGGLHPYFGPPLKDPITGEYIYGCTYPRESKLVYYMDSPLIIGGIVGRDTLVSAWSLNPEVGALGKFRFESLDINKRDIYSDNAHSDLDIICEYYDTITRADLVERPTCEDRSHIPLELRVTQRSMAWSGADLGDFILFDYEIETMGDQTVRDVWVAFLLGWEVGHESDFGNPPRYVPCRVGMLREYEVDGACGYLDHPNVAYAMSRDGHPTDGSFDERSPLGAVGFMFLGTSSDTGDVHFNWQTQYNISGQSFVFMPQRDLGMEYPPLNVSSCYWGGFWSKDVWLYATMSRPEIDYDQITTAVNKTAQGWQPPPSNAIEVATELTPEAILSFGPLKLGPGLKTRLSMALVAGDNVHTDPNAFANHFNPEYPERYTDNWLDFSELAENSRWARKVYDNPGFDTDGDGNRGEYIICNGDTIWTVGDGVPDFRADIPPPSPLLKVIPTQGKLVIRWNGYYSENYIDPFSLIQDFEGYRVYVGRDERESSLSLISSFDRENYVRLTQVELPSGVWDWSSRELPFSLDSLKIIYGDPDFDPLLYSRHDPLVFGGERYYFTMMDANLSDLANPNEIHKVYPEAVNPGPDSTAWTEDDVTNEHGKPLPKFYEYEYSLDNLLPTVSYFVGVTAFDFGFAAGGIPAKESKVINSLVESYALTSADTAVQKDLDVYVYPNPYRVDAGYTKRGFENRYHDRIADRARLIHFANLPNVCTIRIFSLDGDLIRTIYHDYPKDDPAAMHDTWDLISRNVQAVGTGLYYWTVESEKRTQIGKLVIIK